MQPRERPSRLYQLAPALIGLLGVLIGAGVTSGVTYLGDHRRAKAEERGAERLVLAEVLADAHASVPGQLLASSWVAERERLARSLSNAEWAWVARFYRDVGAAGRTDGLRRLKADAPCALAALNVWLYSDAPSYRALRSTRACTKPPPGAL